MEVSTDGGKTWADAQLRPAAGQYTWVQWTYPWMPAQAGDTTLVVRATDGTGAGADPQEADNYPDGATGYHYRQVHVG